MVRIYPINSYSNPHTCLDAQMKVSLDVLQRVYDAFQNSGENSTEQEQEAVEPDSHLHFIDAFDMPLWHWSQERSTFERRVYFIAVLRQSLNM